MGDWKDHLKPPISSLKIKIIDNNNLSGFRRFKIYLPNTRNGDNEIFFTTILRYLNFPSYYTSNIEVNLNGKTFGALLQEDASKEFLGNSLDEIATENEWISPAGKAQCSDTTRIRFFSLPDGGRGIDYRVTLRATHGDVKFGDTKEGSMGIRTHPALRLQGKVATGKATMNFSPDLFISNLIQYDNASDSVGINSRLQWEYRPGAKFFLVVNQSYLDQKTGLSLQGYGTALKLGTMFRF